MKLTIFLASLSLASCATTSRPMPVIGVTPTLASVSPTVTSSSVLPAIEPSTLQTQNPGASAANATDSRVTLYLGNRSFDKGVWQPVEDQFSFMIEYAHEAPDSVVGWEVGFGYSADSGKVLGFDVDGQTYEIYGGVVKSFLQEDAPVRPYVGGGLSFINGKFEVASLSDDDNSIAPYLHGGAAFDITPAFSLGIDLRFLFASDITLFDASGDADYTQFTIFAGWNF